MGDPKGFLKYKRQESKRRPKEERTQDWKELIEPLPDKSLKNQASRCMDCGVPFCQSPYGCPVENRIPDWNDLVSQGKWKEALEALHATNNFPEFTGRLCPAPCESACVLGINDKPVIIREIENTIIETGFAKGWVRPSRLVSSSGKRVAIVGSGPAGLAAAQELVRQGHGVVVFEKSPKVGGLLRYGIPEFKLEKWVIDRRISQLQAEGVEFKTGVTVGLDIEVQKLRQDFDALCLAIGAEKPRDFQIPGRRLKGIHFALDYLTQQNRRNHDEPLIGEEISARDKRVVIIGGGDTGSDVLGTVHRQACKSVVQLELLPQPPLERADITPWPLWPLKLKTSHAHEEGGMREWSVSTIEFRGENDHVSSLRVQRLARDNGSAHPIAGSEFDIPADLVILAMGFTGVAGSSLLTSLSKLSLDRFGAISSNEKFMTNIDGVFCAGDAHRGASLIVWAIAEGRKMAYGVGEYLASGCSWRTISSIT